MLCLVLQAAGGALSTNSNGSSNTGIDITMAGLILQVIVIFFFIVAFADYMVSYVRRTSGTTRLATRVRVFLAFLSLAITLILVRCIYRAYELSQGYRDSDLITDETLFIVLEGVYVDPLLSRSPAWNADCAVRAFADSRGPDSFSCPCTRFALATRGCCLTGRSTSCRRRAMRERSLDAPGDGSPAPWIDSFPGCL